jgi:hypothetical protein
MLTVGARLERAFRKLPLEGDEVGNTWIVNLRHYLTPNGAMPGCRLARTSSQSTSRPLFSRRLAIVDAPPTVRCRCRPRRQRCPRHRGVIFDAEDDDRIDWHCPIWDDKKLAHFS